MSDKPIIFSAPMVRALLDGRKTQTRRVLKPQPDRLNGGRPLNDGRGSYSVEGGWKRIPYAARDRLWVREAFTRGDEHKFMVAYKADGECGAWGWDGDGKPVFIHHGYVVEVSSSRGQFGYSRYGGRWRSPIHMPRWASRITLAVTDVRVQRVQEISEADARAEGVRGDASGPWGCEGLIEDFADLWNSIHGPDAWDANPWVTAYTFAVER